MGKAAPKKEEAPVKKEEKKEESSPETMAPKCDMDGNGSDPSCGQDIPAVAGPHGLPNVLPMDSGKQPDDPENTPSHGAALWNKIDREFRDKVQKKDEEKDNEKLKKG